MVGNLFWVRPSLYLLLVIVRNVLRKSKKKYNYFLPSKTVFLGGDFQGTLIFGKIRPTLPEKSFKKLSRCLEYFLNKKKCP